MYLRRGRYKNTSLGLISHALPPPASPLIQGKIMQQSHQKQVAALFFQLSPFAVLVFERRSAAQFAVWRFSPRAIPFFFLPLSVYGSTVVGTAPYVWSWGGRRRGRNSGGILDKPSPKGNACHNKILTCNAILRYAVFNNAVLLCLICIPDIHSFCFQLACLTSVKEAKHVRMNKTR